MFLVNASKRILKMSYDNAILYLQNFIGEESWDLSILKHALEIKVTNRLLEELEGLHK